MPELQEQAFGHEGVERSLGYVPANVEMRATDEREGDISIQHTELRDAAKEIADARDQERVAREGRSVDSEVRVQDTRGDHLPPNETLTPEEASWLVTGARNKQETVTDLNERDELAREIDALRNGTTYEELQAESQPPVQQPQPEVAPHIAQNEGIARKLQESPELLAAVQQAIANEQYKAVTAAQQYAGAVAQNAHAAVASLAAFFPELGSLRPDQIEAGIRVVASRDPQRAQEILNHLSRIEPLVRENVRVQQAQQQHTAALYQQWQANQQAQFQQAALQHDQAYDAYANAETSSAAERKAIEAEALQLLREGGDDQQIYHAYNTNWAMRSATAQKALFEAARARLARKGAKSKLHRPIPNVQRPGSPLERASDLDYAMRNLEKPGKDLTAKEAAALVTARRAARR
jgi:hypothetical protein